MLYIFGDAVINVYFSSLLHLQPTFPHPISLFPEKNTAINVPSVPYTSFPGRRFKMHAAPHLGDYYAIFLTVVKPLPSWTLIGPYVSAHSLTVLLNGKAAKLREYVMENPKIEIQALGWYSWKHVILPG